MRDDLSLSLTEALSARIRLRFGDILNLRRRIHSDEAGLVETLGNHLECSFDEAVSELILGCPASESFRIETACREPLFQRRIIQTVLETIYSEQIGPPLKIIPDGFAAEAGSFFSQWKILRERTVHAVVFEYLPTIANEIFPLMIDAYVHNLANKNSPQLLFLGVHTSWLDEEARATRAIFYDEDRDELIEMSLASPLLPDSVHFLCLSPETHRRYSRIYEAAKVFQVNPYAAAEAADDKYACFLRWRQAGIPTPDAIRIPGADSSKSLVLEVAANAFHALFADATEEVTLLVQPNRGTEGRGARAFTGSPEWKIFLEKNPDLLGHIQNIACRDEVLLRRGVGNVLLQSAPGAEFVYFDVRVNTANGKAESGFIMAAQPREIIASPSHGGRIVEWKPKREFLFQVKPGANTFPETQEMWDRVKQIAEQAAAGFPECRLAGIDIRLDRFEKPTPHWVPWVLDLNPRPAGLTHARYFDTGEPGVTRWLWSDLPQK